MLTLRVRETLCEAYAVLFSGERIRILGGSVPSGGEISLSFFQSRIYGLACPTLANVPAAADRSTEMKTAVISVFFFTVNPLLIIDYFRGKSVFVKVY
jgi:hypothetical protein